MAMEQKNLADKPYRQDALDWTLNILILVLMGISYLCYGFYPLSLMVVGGVMFAFVLGLLSLIISVILQKPIPIRFRLFVFRLLLLVCAIIGLVQTMATVDLQRSIRDHPSNYQNGKSL